MQHRLLSELRQYQNSERAQMSLAFTSEEMGEVLELRRTLADVQSDFCLLSTLLHSVEEDQQNLRLEMATEHDMFKAREEHEVSMVKKLRLEIATDFARNMAKEEHTASAVQKLKLEIQTESSRNKAKEEHDVTSIEELRLEMKSEFAKYKSKEELDASELQELRQEIATERNMRMPTELVAEASQASLEQMMELVQQRDLSGVQGQFPYPDRSRRNTPHFFIGTGLLANDRNLEDTQAPTTFLPPPRIMSAQSRNVRQLPGDSGSRQSSVGRPSSVDRRSSPARRTSPFSRSSLAAVARRCSDGWAVHDAGQIQSARLPSDRPTAAQVTERLATVSKDHCLYGSRSAAQPWGEAVYSRGAFNTM